MFTTTALRIGGIRDQDGTYRLRLTEGNTPYDLTNLTIQDLIAVRDHLTFVINNHKP
jgi:hypothetical protein